MKTLLFEIAPLTNVHHPMEVECTYSAEMLIL